MIKHILNITLILCCVLLMAGCNKPKPPAAPTTKTDTITKTGESAVAQPVEETTKMETPKTDLTPVKPKTLKTGKYAVISVKSGGENLGQIKIELNKKEAPKTCENFVKLAEKGFYNGLTFHRVIPGFVIQGGDPSGDGTGGPGYTVPAEISPNLKHVRGAVATARTGDAVNPTKASSGSQFYICHAPAHFLDGNYTIFGIVVQGLDVVDKIANTKTGPGDKPITPVIMEKVVIE